MIAAKIRTYVRERSRDQVLTLLSFGFLTGWVISLPYEGPVLYGYITTSGQDLLFINSYNLFFLLQGFWVELRSHAEMNP